MTSGAIILAIICIAIIGGIFKAMTPPRWNAGQKPRLGGSQPPQKTFGQHSCRSTGR